MPGNGEEHPLFRLPIMTARIKHSEARGLFCLLVEYLGRHLHTEPGGCTDIGCPCFAKGYDSGYEDGRQDEREEPGEPVRDESRD